MTILLDPLFLKDFYMYITLSLWHSILYLLTLHFFSILYSATLFYPLSIASFDSIIFIPIFIF